MKTERGLVLLARTKLNSIIKMVEEASSSSPIEKQFVTDLNFSIEKTDSSIKHTPSRTFKPSSIGTCSRAIYFQLVGTQRDIEQRSSSTMVGILENGTDRHIRIQQAIDDMAKNGIDCEYLDVAQFIKDRGLSDKIEIVSKEGMETKCYCPEYNVSFLTDGIIKYKGKYYILEIKTMNAQKFIESKAVRDEHKAQGVLYCILFNLDRVMYLYEDRNTLKKKAFVYEVSEEEKTVLINKMAYIELCVSRGTPPDIPVDKKCTYCNYISWCEKIAEG